MFSSKEKFHRRERKEGREKINPKLEFLRFFGVPEKIENDLQKYSEFWFCISTFHGGFYFASAFSAISAVKIVF